MMQEKLLHAYMEKSFGKKTLIFNNGIHTSLYVYETFKKAGLNIRHLDNTTPNDERKSILKWFKKTPNAILTSVSILTTGFDEPTVESIILNRATKSITLYFQMIGRGSRRLPHKTAFTIIDLGNNALRFGLWNAPVDWQQIFKSPEFYLASLRDDAEIERNFTYEMPPELRKKFAKTTDFSFDLHEEFKKTVKNNLKAKTVIDLSIQQHTRICVENADDSIQAKFLAKELHDDIDYRVRQYCVLLGNTTKNYRLWLIEDYKEKLILEIARKMRLKLFT
jgi:type I site-specific restriction endonuclease